MPQSSCDVLSYLTKQSWSITGLLTFPPHDNSKCSVHNNKLKLWKTSPVLVYKILYSKSLRGRRGLIKFLSNWTPKIKINIKNTDCTAPPHTKRGLKSSFHNIHAGIKKDKHLYLTVLKPPIFNHLKNKIFVLCSKLYMGA